MLVTLQYKVIYRNENWAVVLFESGTLYFGRGGVDSRSANTNDEAQSSMSTIPQRELYRLINEANDRGERVVVATVAHTRGSTPQQRGAKMLFFQNGEVAGTVGGGCIEAEVWAEAKEALRSGESRLHHFSLTADEASEEGMVCGGTMDVFVEVIV
jgi:xanthine dehydrogenase accessory factor